MGILVTGGAGYIGSHTCVDLLETGYEVIVADNLINSKREALNRVEEITGRKLRFYEVDIADKPSTEIIFRENSIEGVIHFAALKSVGESVSQPLMYYGNNISATLTLLELMEKYDVTKFVFSSSATVYGDPASVPISEDFPLKAVNPYGNTKIIVEDILKDLCKANNRFKAALLRYFNPVGAHPSGRIGEEPRGIPNNLMPYITQIAVGRLDQLQVFGNDYDTVDGTGVRDYIHVEDLAHGHILALAKLDEIEGCEIYNLGTGKGVSVLEMIRAFEKASGKTIPYKIAGRREGDVAACYADPEKARRELGFTCEKNLDDMCRDSWRWQTQNPNGY